MVPFLLSTIFLPPSILSIFPSSDRDGHYPISLYDQFSILSFLFSILHLVSTTSNFLSHIESLVSIPSLKPHPMHIPPLNY